MDGQSAERLVVAFVRGVHGLRGAVRVEVLTDHPEARLGPGSVLHREGDDRSLTIVEGVPDGPGWRIRFVEIADRDAADGLRERYLEADVAPAADSADGSVYWHDVVGATVRDLAERELGTVTDVYRVGENDVYVVTGGPVGEFDLPAVRAFIRTFDPKGEGIVVDADALGLQLAGPRAGRRMKEPGSEADRGSVGGEATPGARDGTGDESPDG